MAFYIERLFTLSDSNRKPSNSLTLADAIEIWRRIKAGEFLNRIAADFDVNPGRISEIKTGKRFPGSEALA